MTEQRKTWAVAAAAFAPLVERFGVATVDRMLADLLLFADEQGAWHRCYVQHVACWSGCSLVVERITFTRKRSTIFLWTTPVLVEINE